LNGLTTSGANTGRVVFTAHDVCSRRARNVPPVHTRRLIGVSRRRLHHAARLYLMLR
jgi:hypothetical protein